MPDDPELEDFRTRVLALAKGPLLGATMAGDTVRLRELDLEAVEHLLREEAGYYLLTAAGSLTRTTLREATETAEARIVKKTHRRAYAVHSRLPVQASFEQLADRAVTLRASVLRRIGRGAVESLLRVRLEDEGIPLLMSPPIRQVPGVLIKFRKPDGVWPDPSSGLPPRLYLEVKNVRRPRDDIQKRLYEIVETSLEMKVLYGKLALTGFNLGSTREVAGNPKLQAKLRQRILRSSPVVVAFFICPKAAAETYRPGAEAFIDRLFFQEELDDCLDFLRSKLEEFQAEGSTAETQ